MEIKTRHDELIVGDKFDHEGELEIGIIASYDDQEYTYLTKDQVILLRDHLNTILADAPTFP